MQTESQPASAALQRPTETSSEGKALARARILSHRPWQPLRLTTDWTFVRFHYGHRGRRGNYSETELREWADKLRDVRR